MAILLFLPFISLHAQPSETQRFRQFIAEVKQEALREGVSAKTVHKYLDSLPVPPSIQHSAQLKLSRHQAQQVLSYDKYVQRLVPRKKLLYAKQMQHRYHTLLRKIEKIYGVPPGIILALWGAESNFGRYQGKYQLIPSLAYIAFARDRKSYFRAQVVYALKILDRPKIIPQMLTSSFDGGMGQPQFMPGSYLVYAVDFDRSGLANIWTGTPDVLASIANFMQKMGWKRGERWGWQVWVPSNFSPRLANVKKRHSVAYWRHHGIRLRNGKPLPNIKADTSIVMPAGKKGPAYLVTTNFYVLMRWNHIIFESLSVGVFADALASSYHTLP